MRTLVLAVLLYVSACTPQHVATLEQVQAVVRAVLCSAPSSGAP